MQGVSFKLVWFRLLGHTGRNVPVGTGDENEELLVGCSCVPGGSLSFRRTRHSDCQA
jgi:hypothetical protein